MRGVLELHTVGQQGHAALSRGRASTHNARSHATRARLAARQVYVSSAGLGSDAVVSFVRALAAISSDELADVASPRVFSLTKIVEISHFNMGRIRCGAAARGRGSARQYAMPARAGCRVRALTQRRRTRSAPPRSHPCCCFHPCNPPPPPPPRTHARARPAAPGWCGAASGACWRPTSRPSAATPTWRSRCTRSTRCASWP